MLPELITNEINLFLLKIPVVIDQQQQATCFNQLNQVEQLKQQRFYFKQDRNLYLMAHSFLRMVLAEYIGCFPQSLVFIENKYGKPALKDYPDIQFNLSHSKNKVALAVCCNDHIDLGVDIECGLERGNVTDLAAHFFSSAEVTQLLKQPISHQNDVFFQFWTLKESYIKAIGMGLSIDLNSFSFSSINPVIAIEQHTLEEHRYGWCFYYAKPFKGFHLSIAIRNNKKIKIQPHINSYEYFPNLVCKPIHLNFVTSS